MAFRNRVVHRATGLFVRWGLVEHPYGHEYARERYTLTGRRVPDRASTSGAGIRSRAQMGLVAAALLLASLMATGLLFSR